MSSPTWFANRPFDLAFFHLPVWLCWLIAFTLPKEVIALDVPLWVWVAVVLVIDVGHVWSSIYRTYWDPVTRAHQGGVLKAVPLVCFGACFLLAIQSETLFWRVLAYVAVYHFIKQQVGIAALCRARHFQSLGDRAGFSEAQRRLLFRLDKAAVYAGTVCPVIWWHLHLPRKFSWFIPGDFLDLGAWLGQVPVLAASVHILLYVTWIGVLAAWLAVHLRLYWLKRVPLPGGKLLWIAGTAVNWYLGLVYFDSDLVFTLTNVVAHGVPYYGLIALHGYRKLQDRRVQRQVPTARPLWPVVALLALPILLLAYTEEFFWDFLLYRDHGPVFSWLGAHQGQALSNEFLRAWSMAALALPQTVHYVLDGFIWKSNGRNPDLKKYLFP
jgi:hypothetical protein